MVRSESGDDGFWKEIVEEVYKDVDRFFKMIGEVYIVFLDVIKVRYINYYISLLIKFL